MEGKGRRGGNGRDCRNRIVCTGQYLDIWYGQLMHTTAINFIDKGTPAPVKSTTTQQHNQFQSVEQTNNNTQRMHAPSRGETTQTTRRCQCGQTNGQQHGQATLTRCGVRLLVLFFFVVRVVFFLARACGQQGWTKQFCQQMTHFKRGQRWATLQQRS